MSLRVKTSLCIGATLLVLMVVLYLVASHIWLDNFAELENQAARKNMERSIVALDEELQSLCRLDGDWSGWDDTYQFVDDHNARYIEANLTDETFTRNNVNLMVYVNRVGELVYGNLTSNYTGPIRGSLIIGRYLDENELQLLSNITGLSLQAFAANQQQLPSDIQAARSTLAAAPHTTPESAQQNILIKILDDHEIASYTVLSDLLGQPAVLLRVSTPREIYAQGQRGIGYLVLALTLVGLAFGALTFFLLNRLLLARLSQLNRDVNRVEASGNLAVRIPVKGTDELAALASDINQMLAALESAQGVNQQLLAETRRQLEELAVLHTASITTAGSPTLDQALHKIAQATFELFKATNVMVLQVNPAGDELEVRASIGVPTALLALRQIKVGQGIIGWVAQTQQPAQVPNVDLDARYYNADRKTRSELCVPLCLEQHLIGVINVESDRLNAFSENDQQLLTTLAHNLSIIIENIRLLENIRAANERLQEIDRLKSQFLSSTSHELRTPLNAIIGFSELLIDGVPGPLTTDQRDYVNHIHASSQHLLALINDILDLSKIQAGRLTLNRCSIDLAELLAEMQSIIAPALQRKQQHFQVELLPNVPFVTADPLRLKQILLNLLGNACKFTPDNGTIELRVTRLDAGTIRFGVSDTGLGIPREQQSWIFEEFRQVDPAIPYGGTGLGLAIARRLVELHGGTIWVESAGQPGLGSLFYFTLPV